MPDTPPSNKRKRLLSRIRLDHLVLTTDMMGTALFAAEGATTGIRVHLDILGVIVLAFVTALGGGIIRDLLLGALPPNAIRDWRYPAIALVTGLAMFVLHARASTMALPLLLTLDAAGISFVAVAGATKALEFNLHPLLATMLGGISGVGGGTVRDMLINRIPLVLQADVTLRQPCLARQLRCCSSSSGCARGLPTLPVLQRVSVFACWPSDTAGICPLRGHESGCGGIS